MIEQFSGDKSSGEKRVLVAMQDGLLHARGMGACASFGRRVCQNVCCMKPSVSDSCTAQRGATQYNAVQRSTTYDTLQRCTSLLHEAVRVKLLHAQRVQIV
jgi:hypothetical protein